MLIRGNTLSNMQLLTELEGRTVKYLARSHDVRIEHRAIKKSQIFFHLARPDSLSQ